MSTTSRKQEHINICLKKDVSFKLKSTGFEGYYFNHNALPEMDFKDIDITTRFLKRKINAPFYLSPITGGASIAKKINRNLAITAQRFNIPIGLGSQRAALENPSLAKTFRIRDIAPDAMIFANIGAVQLNYGYNYRHCRKIVDMIDADALVLHINPLQEAIQPEGDINFSNLLPKIEELTSKINVPVIAKEVGNGISGETAIKLEKAGVRCIDVAGAGGTSWAAVESYRSKSRLGEVFREWGIPTAECIKEVRKATQLEIIASGGIRSGLDAAKAICLGANIAGIAAPLLKPALNSSKALEKYISGLIKQLKTAMFCTGAKNIRGLDMAKLRKRLQLNA